MNMRRIASAAALYAALATSASLLEAKEPSPDFRRLESHARGGYTAELWEFYPDDFLAVKAYVLLPDGAMPGRTPAVICMGDGCCSIQHLAGEPDPYGSDGGDAGCRAYHAVRAGYVAVALARPGVANGCPDDIDSADSRRRFLALLPESGWTEQGLVDLEVSRCVGLLKSIPAVDASRISVMGFGDGAMILGSAKTVPGVSVCEAPPPQCGRDPSAGASPGRPFLARGKRMMSERDYLPTRPDGRTEWTFAWAMKQLRAALKPRTPWMLNDKETYLKWLEGKHAEWRSRMGNWQLTSEFKLLKDERRDGYALRTYEFYPWEGLAVKTVVLVPDGAKPGKTPVVVCMPGSGGSLQGLAGEPDPYWTRYPVRNKQAWWYCQMGMIGVGLESPGNANNAHDDVWYWKSQQKTRSYWNRFECNGRKMDENTYDSGIMACCINFLLKDPLVDPKKIAVSGLSLGAHVIYSALSNPNVAACCYNDFAIYRAPRRTSITRCMSDVVYTDMFGDGATTWLCMPPKHLLLNEGGAWKGHVENVAKAYEFAGCPEKLTIHHYDRYSYAPHRKWDSQDMLEARDYDYEDFFRHNNCDPYDHSFHPESALPWLCKIFFGRYEPGEKVKLELLRAGTERERSPYQAFPPDARKGRKAVGPLKRELSDDMLVPERPDGRTEMTATWAKMMYEKQRKPGY